MNTSDTQLPRQLVSVDLNDRSYDIAITSHQWALLPEMLREWTGRKSYLSSEPGQMLLVTDENVARLFANEIAELCRKAGWNVVMEILPAGEKTKSQEQTTRLYDRLVDMRADRRTLVLAVGGGVIGDLAGFVAASYARGLPFVQCPTTLLAAVDSSVGGKVGINHPRGKNLIGAFHQPLGVFIDTSAIVTLPERDYRSGLAEIVKYGVILDESLFEKLEQQVAAIQKREPEILTELIARSCRLKADVVEEDEFERSGLRAILNYGHTFAHAYEALCGYGELMHGEAVSIGMIDASRLAEKLQRIPSTVTERQLNLLNALNLPVSLPENSSCATEDVLDRMMLDKKTVGGKLRFVLPSRIGHVEVVAGVDPALVREVLDSPI